MTRHNNSDVENFFATASKEELIDYLVKKINSEVEKGDDADCDLIRECSDWLDELTEDEIVFTPEELERNLERIKAKVASNKPIKIRKKASWKIFVRVTLAAAVLFTISIAALSALAVNQGYDSVWFFISTNAEKILGMNNGDALDNETITYIRHTESNSYTNLEELLTQEDLSIIYPTNLPNHLKITKVLFTLESDIRFVLTFVFSNNSCSMNVTNYCTTDLSLLDQQNIVLLNGYECYITQKNENLFHALFQHNDFEYIIQCNNYDELCYIISNMKELKK